MDLGFWSDCLEFLWLALAPLLAVGGHVSLVIVLVPPLGQAVARWSQRWAKWWSSSLLLLVVISLVIHGGLILHG